MQDYYSFLQNAQKTKNCKNCNKLHIDKNQINKNCYKTKSNFLFRAILLLVSFLISVTVLFSLTFPNDTKRIKGAVQTGVFIYAYVDKTTFPSFIIHHNGKRIECEYSSSYGYYEGNNPDVAEGAYLLVVPEAPNGYLWKNRSTGVIYENGVINEKVKGDVFSVDAVSISIELVKVTPTTNEVSINVSITGNYKSEASGVILYLMKDNAIQSQIVANNNVPIKLTQKIGETFTILVSKPYMWTMTVSGDCTRDDDNNNKITYTVASTAQTITLEFSGGCASSMIAV